MINANQINIKDCAVTSAKWGAAVALASFALWIVVSGMFNVFFDGATGEVIFSYIKAFVVPRLGVALLDFAMVFYIAFLVTTLKSNWSQRRALLTVTQ